MASLLSSFLVVGGLNNAQAQESDSSDVSAASGSNRFVVWQDGTPGNYDVLFRRSTDNGATWKAVVNLSNNPGNSLDPQLVVSGSKVYIVWIQSSADGSLADVFFRGSTNNGGTWGPKVKISSSGSNSAPGIAASGSNVYITWQDDDPNDVFFKRSTNSGATWQSIENLSDNAGRSIDPRVAASGPNVYVVWADETSDNFEILLQRSTDNGATWEELQNISDNGGDSFGPEIAVSGSHTYIVWRDNSTGTGRTNILFSRSADNGATWQPVFDVSSDNRTNSGPQIAVSGSSVYIVWVKQISSDGSEIYFRGSTNNGDTWGLRKKISNSGTDFSVFSPDIAASGSNVYVTWSDDNASDVFFRRSTDNGASWKAIINMSNTTNLFSQSPQIAVAGSSVFLVWSDQAIGNHDIVLKRSTNSGSSWKALKNLSDNAGSSELPQVGA